MLFSALAMQWLSTFGLISRDRQLPSGAKPIIIDTDMQTDVDDVGALAIANTLYKAGLCDLRAVMINTNSQYGALTASVVNTYYGNEHVPIAALRPITNETFFDRRTFQLSDYASKVAHNFPRTLNRTEDTLAPLELYRTVLEDAKDLSVTIISIGFLTNLADLVRDEEGAKLLKSKVRELVIMGGSYPSGWEYNFGGVDPASTSTLLNFIRSESIPTTFSGYELGKNILSGQNLRRDAPADSPILAAYEWYNGRCSTTRESWDPLTVLYGILGLQGEEVVGEDGPLLAYANTNGYNSITTMVNASNAWVHDENITSQHWLELRDGITNRSVGRELTRLFAGGRGDWACEL